MLVYYVLLTLSFLLKPLLKDKKKYFICMFCFLGIVTGIRAESVGADTSMYYQLFYSYANYSFIDILFNYDYENDMDIELGTRLLISISSCISESPSFFIFVSSIISYALYGFFLYDNTNEKNYWIATSIIISMGFCFYSMAILRQALATAIAIQGVYFIKKQYYFKAVMIVFIAAMFHSTVLVLLPVYLLTILLKDKIHKNDVIYVYLTSIIFISFLLATVGNLFINNIELLSPRIARYFFLTDLHSVGSENGLYYSIMIILYFSIVVIADCQANRENTSINRVIIFLSSICLTLDSLCFVFKENMRIVLRLAYHFEPFAWLLLSYVIAGIQSKYIKLYIIVIFILISFITLRILGALPANWEAVPYETFFSM